MNGGQEPRMMQNNMTRSQALSGALEKPNGARFYRCALQVKIRFRRSRPPWQAVRLSKRD